MTQQRLQRGTFWCPRHPDTPLIRTDLPSGKFDLRCPDCTRAKREAIAVVGEEPER